MALSCTQLRPCGFIFLENCDCRVELDIIFRFLKSRYMYVERKGYLSSSVYNVLEVKIFRFNRRNEEKEWWLMRWRCFIHEMTTWQYCKHPFTQFDIFFFPQPWLVTFQQEGWLANWILKSHSSFSISCRRSQNAGRFLSFRVNLNIKETL